MRIGVGAESRIQIHVDGWAGEGAERLDCLRKWGVFVLVGVRVWRLTFGLNDFGVEVFVLWGKMPRGLGEAEQGGDGADQEGHHGLQEQEGPGGT